jgi:hypothetical protein
MPSSRLSLGVVLTRGSIETVSSTEGRVFDLTYWPSGLGPKEMK